MSYKEVAIEEIKRLINLGWVYFRASSLGHKEHKLSKDNLEVSFPEEFWDPNLGNRSGTSPWALFRAELVAKTLKTLQISLLWEVGSGDGNIALPLRRYEIETICIEPLSTGAEVLSNNDFITYRDFLQNLYLPPNSIKAFGCFDVIEHIENPAQLVGEMYRTLEPGGVLILTVPAHQWLFASFDLSIGHYRRYSRKTLLALFDKFQVQEIFYIFPSLVIPAFILRRIPYILFGPRNKQKHRNDVINIHYLMKKAKSIFMMLFRFESRIGLPFGLSLYCVVQKPQTEDRMGD